MRRREIAGPALTLHSAIEALARGYRRRDYGRNHAETLKRWQLVILRLAEFMHQVQDVQEESETSMEALWLTEELSHFIESVRKGRPSVADRISRPPGQKLDSGAEHDLVRCSVAVTCFMKAGDSKETAAKRVASMMKEVGIPFPPVRRRTIPPWQALNNWRDKLITVGKGTYSYKQYRGAMQRLTFTEPSEWRSYAEELLHMMGGKD